MARRKSPEINAGSMADIAFLLLIFFLVTTTMNVDMGIARKLPEKTDQKPEVIVKEKNVLDIVINRNNQLLIENEIATVPDVKKLAMKFIDNGGGLSAPKDGKPGEPCDYCNGAKDPNSSDHPSKAVISLQSDRGTKYGMYIAVQNQIEEAYNELRNKLSERLYGRSFDDLQSDYDNSPNNMDLKAKIENIRDKYPQIISEPDPIK